MDEQLESWVYFDGPEPEPVRDMLDLLRELPPATAEDAARLERTFFATLDAELFGAPLPPPAERPQDAAPPARAYRLEVASPDPEDAGPSDVLPAPPPAPAIEHARPAVVGTSLDTKLPPLARPRPSEAEPLPSCGETAPSGDDIARAARAFPLIPDTPDADFTLGGMTVAQYASLRAELDVRPEAEAEILEGYRLRTTAARAALDARWQQHLACNRERRALFEETLARFTAHVRERQAWEQQR